MSTLFRADFRRDQRFQRREIMTSPYGRKPSSLKKPPKNQSPTGLWDYIKSWSFFTPQHDSDPSSSDEEEVDINEHDDASQAIPRLLQIKRSDHSASSSSENSNSGNEGAATSGGSANSSPSASSSLRTLAPHKPVIAALRPQRPLPMAPLPPPARAPSRPADPIVIERKKAQVTPVGPSPSSPPPEAAVNTEQRSVQLQVVNFLKSKRGELLTKEEYERIEVMLSSMVDDNAPPGDTSILEAIIQKQKNGNNEQSGSSGSEKPTEEAAPTNSEKASDEAASAAEGGKTDQPAESGGEEGSSPAISTHGLPPFRRRNEDGSNEQDSKAQTTDEPSTEDEEAKWEARLQRRNFEIRRYLNLDYMDYNSVDGWEDLLRYKDVPRKHWIPELIEAHEIAYGTSEIPETTDVEMQGEATEPTEEEIPKAESANPVKEFRLQRDFTKGYTPAQAMVNPYDRIAAFARRRKHPHKLGSLSRPQPVLESMDTTSEAETSVDSEMLPPPEPPLEKLGDIRVINKLKPQLATGYEDNPIAEEPETRPGTAGDGRAYVRVKKRKAATMFIEVDDEEDGPVLLDGPLVLMGHRQKRRKSGDQALSDEESDSKLVDLHLQHPLVVLDEFVDHTPVKRSAPSAASISLEKQKWKPKLKRSKRMRGVAHDPLKRARSKRFLNPPVIPSPLRNGSKRASNRKLLSGKLLHDAKPKEKAKVAGEIPSYEFSESSPRIGSIGPIRATREMAKAKREVNVLEPYKLTEYRRAFKRSNRSPTSTKSSLANIDVAAKLIKPTKSNSVRNNRIRKFKTTPEMEIVVLPLVEEPIEDSDMPVAAVEPGGNGEASKEGDASGAGQVNGAGGKKGQNYYDLRLKPAIKLDIPPPPRKLIPGPSRDQRLKDWAISGQQPLLNPGGKWTCNICHIGNKADAEACINCKGSRRHHMIV